jgi:hypothetical protein
MARGCCNFSASAGRQATISGSLTGKGMPVPAKAYCPSGAPTPRGQGAGCSVLADAVYHAKRKPCVPRSSGVHSILILGRQDGCNSQHTALCNIHTCSHQRSTVLEQFVLSHANWGRTWTTEVRSLKFVSSRKTLVAFLTNIPTPNTEETPLLPK